MRKCCQLFQKGRINLHDDEESGRANNSSGKFSSTLRAVPTLHQGIAICLAGQSLRSDGGKKDIVQDWLKGLAAVCDAGVGKLVP